MLLLSARLDNFNETYSCNQTIKTTWKLPSELRRVNRLEIIFHEMFPMTLRNCESLGLVSYSKEIELLIVRHFEQMQQSDEDVRNLEGYGWEVNLFLKFSDRKSQFLFTTFGDLRFMLKSLQFVPIMNLKQTSALLQMCNHRTGFCVSAIVVFNILI